MHRKHLHIVLIIIIFVAAVISIGIFAMRVGGNLCGPVCAKFGLHYYEQDCLGLKIRTTVFDAYWDTCYGLPVGGMRCYGVPYTEKENFEDRLIDCNYPCNDADVKAMCRGESGALDTTQQQACQVLLQRCMTD